MKMNPVFKNELKLNARTSRLTGTVFVFNIILGLISLLSFYRVLDLSKYLGSYDYMQIVKLYMMMAYAEFGMLVLFIPSITSGCISGERERQTLEILLTTKLSPWQIITGKLMSSLSMIMTLAISTLPIISVVFIFGGIRLRDLAMFIVSMVVSAIFIGSIGIFYSAMVKKTTSATVATYATVAALLAGTLLLVTGIHALIETRMLNAESYQPANIKGGVYLLLLNPAISFYGLISRQVGSRDELYQLLSSYGNYAGDFIVNHWVAVSLILQITLSVIFLAVAARKINPLKKR